MPEFPPTSPQAQRLIKLFEDAERELLRECNCILLQSSIIGPDDLRVARIKQIRAELLAGSRQWVEEAIPDCYLAGLRAARGNLDPTSLSPLHLQTMDVLAQSTFSRLAGVVDVVGRQIDDMIKQHNLAHLKAAMQKAAPGRPTWTS